MNVIINKLNMHYFLFILIVLHDSQLFIFTISSICTGFNIFI